MFIWVEPIYLFLIFVRCAIIIGCCLNNRFESFWSVSISSSRFIPVVSVVANDFLHDGLVVETANCERWIGYWHWQVVLRIFFFPNWFSFVSDIGTSSYWNAFNWMNSRLLVCQIFSSCSRRVFIFPMGMRQFNEYRSVNSSSRRSIKIDGIVVGLDLCI